MNEKLQPLRIGNLESEFPIFQGGMSVGLTTSELASTIANAGGYGTIGGVGLGMSEKVRSHKEYIELNENNLENEINNALEASNDGNIGVNLMVATTDYEKSVEVAVRCRAKFIASGAGLPLNLPEYVNKYRVSGQSTPELIPIVSSVRAAEIIIKRWKKFGVIPSALIVETPNKAGGHLGVTRVEDIGKEEFDLETVIPEMVRALENYNIPIIAAGGIWDRNDIDRALDLNIGARGVQLATRFLTVDECNASDEFKDRHLSNKDSIRVIKSPVGLPGRAIDNLFIKRSDLGEKINAGPCVECLRGCGHRESQFKLGYCIVRALDNARRGEIEKGLFFTGSNGYRLIEDRKKGIVSAKQVMEEITNR